MSRLFFWGGGTTSLGKRQTFRIWGIKRRNASAPRKESVKAQEYVMILRKKKSLEVHKLGWVPGARNENVKDQVWESIGSGMRK